MNKKKVIKVNSLDEYIEKAEDCLKDDNLANGYRYYFRGQSDIDWNIIATLYRQKVTGSDLRNLEIELYRKAIEICEDEFKKLTKAEALAKMQHYGLPTRLIDVTRNKLVALYFACSTEDVKDKDGVVYSFKARESRDIANAYSLLSTGTHTVKMLKNYTKINDEDWKFLTENIKDACVYCPTKKFDRIIAQEGAFIVTGYTLKFDGNNIQLKDDRNNLKEHLNYCSFAIPSDKKDDILKELRDKHDIYKDTLFNYLEEQLKKVKTGVLNDFNIYI